SVSQIVPELSVQLRVPAGVATDPRPASYCHWAEADAGLRRLASLTISLESNSSEHRGRRTHHPADDASAPLIVGGGYSDRFGDSLGVAGAGSLFPKESLVSTLSPFPCSWYIATTSVPSWSAPGRSIAPGGVSSVVPSLRVSRVPVSSTLCT